MRQHKAQEMVYVLHVVLKIGPCPPLVGAAIGLALPAALARGCRPRQVRWPRRPALLLQGAADLAWCPQQCALCREVA